MALVRGGPAGPDGSGGAYPNEVETDRAAWWHALGGRQGVVKGFTHAGVAGQMALDFTPGAALVGERDATGAASQDRGYLVWADSTTRVTFGAASASARNDAVVAAFVDVEDGPVGSGGLSVGPHLVVVPGVSGTTTPRTDAQINTFLGRGGWVRLMDVPVAATDTEINTANVVLANWSARPARARMKFSSSQAFSDGTAATLTAVSSTQTADFTRSSSTLTYNGPKARFLATVAHSWATSTSGHRLVQVVVNGSVAKIQTTAGAPGMNTHQTIAGEIDLSPGDTIRVEARQTSGGSLSAVGGGAGGNELCLREVGPSFS